MSVLDLFAGIGLLIRLVALFAVWPLWVLGAIGRFASKGPYPWDPYGESHAFCFVVWTCAVLCSLTLVVPR